MTFPFIKEQALLIPGPCGQLEAMIHAADGGHADEVGGARQECREGGRERNGAAAGQAAGGSSGARIDRGGSGSTASIGPLGIDAGKELRASGLDDEARQALLGGREAEDANQREKQAEWFHREEDRPCAWRICSQISRTAPRPAGHNNHPFLPIFLRCKPRLPLPIIMRIRNQ